MRGGRGEGRGEGSNRITKQHIGTHGYILIDMCLYIIIVTRLYSIGTCVS